MAICDNCHYKCIFSEIESKMLKLSKIEEDRTHSHAQGRCYMPLPRYMAFSITCTTRISTKWKKASAEVCHKCSKIRGGHWKSSFEFVAPWSHLSWSLFCFCFSASSSLENKTNIPQTSFTGTAESYYRRN